MANVGKNIKQIRINNKMTQEELAEALFVTRQTISNYETGKSNPDIDTIIKIAELFKVDANTVIYGLPVEEKQKRNRSWAIGCGIFLVLLFIIDYALTLFLSQYTEYYLYPPPQNIIRYSLIPFTYFVCGFYTMHIIGLFTPLKPLNNLAAKIIRIVILILTLVLAAGTLYYAAFGICAFMRNYLDLTIYFRWHSFYKLRFFITINTKYQFIFSIFGALNWLFGLIYREK